MANPENPKSNPTPKTDAANPFAAFQAFPSFDPTVMWTQAHQTFTKMMTDAMGRWQSFGDQYAALEKQMTSQAQTTVDNWAQLAKESIAYGAQLSAEARKLSIETAKKMGIGA